MSTYLPILFLLPLLSSLIFYIIICSIFRLIIFPIFRLIYFFEKTLPFIKKTRKKIQECLWQIVCYLSSSSSKYIREIILESDKEENITNIDNLVEKVIKERSLERLSYYEKERLLEFLQNPEKNLDNETLISSSNLTSPSKIKLMQLVVAFLVAFVVCTAPITLYSIILSLISIVIVILTGTKFSFAYFSIHWIISSYFFLFTYFGKINWQCYLLVFYLPIISFIIVSVILSMIINTALIFSPTVSSLYLPQIPYLS
ncbi:MAG: hypothetical protein F6K40_17155 [Okeania sp. SIO3I5]|uniref:hypothetical protein n=1 Tax=Okeania sp. SIO3I5 TaxID=2607805 RepID=UPI0013BAC534|nr:hypothetical protein [Okeania sp. SIO3I5]NEQ37893.1 hypothetical protein [Okeania sp. SIO3I5]